MNYFSNISLLIGSMGICLLECYQFSLPTDHMIGASNNQSINKCKLYSINACNLKSILGRQDFGIQHILAYPLNKYTTV